MRAIFILILIGLIEGLSGTEKPQFPINSDDPHQRLSYRCLVYELAHHNQINAQFKYIGKTGEGENKTFSYELILGNNDKHRSEVYHQSGSSKRRALDEISLQALNRTAYAQPPNGIRQCTFSYSALMLVHEWAQKHRRTVNYNLIEHREGSHPSFVMECSLAPNLKTRGEGTDKKDAKLQAAEKMLIKLQSLGPDDFSAPLTAETAVDMNPISRLHEITTRLRQPEPVYKLLDSISSEGEDGAAVTIFIMEVRADALSATGNGNTMKAAKREASKNLLKLMNLPV